MSKRVQENIIAFLFLFLFIGVIVLSLDLSARARMVPITISAVSAVIMLIQIYLMNFRVDVDLNVDPTELLTGGKTAKDIEEGRRQDQVEEVKIQNLEGGKEIVAILIVLTYLGMTLLIGILPAMFLFVLGFLLFVTKMHWIQSFIIAIITELGIYILFVMILEIQFYKGWLVKLLLG